MRAWKYWICNGFIPQNWYSVCKVPGKLSRGRKPTPHLHSWIIPQAQKHWICNGFIPPNGCSLCKVPGRLSQGNKPTTYILGSFCKLKSTKWQWLHSSKLMFILQSTLRPRTIIVVSGFQECGIEIPSIKLEIVDHIVVCSVWCVKQSQKSQKLCHHKHVLLGIHAICKTAPSAMNIQTIIISYCSEIQQHFVFWVGYI